LHWNFSQDVSLPEFHQTEKQYEPGIGLQSRKSRIGLKPQLKTPFINSLSQPYEGLILVGKT